VKSVTKYIINCKLELLSAIEAINDWQNVLLLLLDCGLKYMIIKLQIQWLFQMLWEENS